MAETFAAVILANAVTAAFIYAMWRLGKNDSDQRAVVIILVCCFIVGLAAYAIRYPT